MAPTPSTEKESSVWPHIPNEALGQSCRAGPRPHFTPTALPAPGQQFLSSGSWLGLHQGQQKQQKLTPAGAWSSWELFLGTRSCVKCFTHMTSGNPQSEAIVLTLQRPKAQGHEVTCPRSRSK